MSVRPSLIVVQHDANDGDTAPGAEGAIAVQEPQNRDPQSLVDVERRDRPAWRSVRDLFADELHDVLKAHRGSIAGWSGRLGVHASFIAKWLSPELRKAPEAPDLLLLPPDVAIALFRTLIARVRAVPALSPAALLDAADALVQEAASTLRAAREALKDGKIDADEERWAHSVAERLEELAAQFRAVRRSAP